MLRRTPILGIVFGGLLAAVTALLFQQAERPFSLVHWVLLVSVSLPPGFGIALHMDPFSKRKREEYLRLDFYREEE